MSEVYQDDNINDYPRQIDTSMALYTAIEFFSPRAKAAQKNTVINKYLYSVGSDFLCVYQLPRSSEYAVVGRVMKCFSPIRRNVNYDVFFQGSLNDCITKFLEMIHALTYENLFGLS